MNVVQFSIEPLLRVSQAFAATPRVLTELNRLLREPQADLNDIAQLLKSDRTLAARLLRIANSAAFGQLEHVASIEDAAALIGLSEIRRLVGAVAVDHFAAAAYPLYGIAGGRLRDNALLVALIVEELARSSQEDPHTAYAAGLFRSLAKPALEKLASTDTSIRPFDPNTGAELVSWEKHTFGISAPDATAAILQQWKFPTRIGSAIARHYWPVDAHEPLVPLLHLAAAAADRLGHGLPGESRYWLPAAEACRLAAFDPDACDRGVERALPVFDRLRRALS